MQIGKQIIVIVIITVPKPLDAPCMWNDDCGMFSECTVADAVQWGPQDGLICRCRYAYVPADGQCLPGLYITYSC
jgi:hypothetical protein